MRTGHRWNPGSNGIVAGVGLRIVHGGGCFLKKSKNRFFLSVEGVLLVKLARKVPLAVDRGPKKMSTLREEKKMSTVREEKSVIFPVCLPSDQPPHLVGLDGCRHLRVTDVPLGFMDEAEAFREGRYCRSLWRLIFILHSFAQYLAPSLVALRWPLLIGRQVAASSCAE